MDWKEKLNMDRENFPNKKGKPYSNPSRHITSAMRREIQRISDEVILPVKGLTFEELFKGGRR